MTRCLDAAGSWRHGSVQAGRRAAAAAKRTHGDEHTRGGVLSADITSPAGLPPLNVPGFEG